MTESLAGRAAVLNLLSMSLTERPPTEGASEGLAASWIRGGFPELVAHPERDASLWYAGYLQTYLERDVRAIRQIGDLGEFQRFLQAAAARNAQLTHLSDLSRELGLAVNTMKTWLRVLEASHQIVLVRPYHRNRGKRLVKAPKVYFWRTSTGQEVDFVVEVGRRLVPIEVKLSKTLTPAMTQSLEGFCDLFPKETSKGYLVSLSDRRVTLSRRCEGLPLSALPALVTER